VGAFLFARIIIIVGRNFLVRANGVGRENFFSLFWVLSSVFFLSLWRRKREKIRLFDIFFSLCFKKKF
jgi:hypothetical protein